MMIEATLFAESAKSPISISQKGCNFIYSLQSEEEIESFDIMLLVGASDNPARI